MEYIVSNITNREIRISTKEIDGKLLYKGHKLGIPEEILPKVIKHYYERAKNSFIFIDYRNGEFLKYNKVKDGMFSSYETLLDHMESKFGKFRNIYIFEY